jgi:hemolysin activation/secretion protein
MPVVSLSKARGTGAIRLRAYLACVCCLLIALMINPVRAADLSSTATVSVREIRIEGAELIEPSVLAEWLPKYRNRTVSAEELLQLAQQLTAHLIERGFVNSGVILPDQKIDEGIVTLKVIGGRVTEVAVRGNRHLSDRYIATRVAPDEAEPFNINAAVKDLQLLQRDPRIKKLNAELKPGLERGFAVLNVDVEQNRLSGVSIGADNHLSPNVGSQQAVVDAYHLSLLGQGDALYLNYRHAEGFSGGTASYSFPLNSYETSLAVNGDYSTSEIVSEPFAVLDIEGKTLGYGLTLRQPLVHSLQTELALSLGVQRQHVESFLLGEPFSFSASDPDGVSDVTMIHFAQEWVRRSSSRVIAIRSSFNVGVAALHASVGGDADGRFVEWLGQGEWLQKIDWLSSTIGFKLQGHVSNDSLPAFRKYALGGASSVRGYRENLITRDNGVLASLEWSVPVVRWPVPWLSDGQEDGQIAVVPFADYGCGWDYLDEYNEPIDLASVGLGVQWRIGRNSGIDLRFAKALISRESLTYDKVLQDDGIHFSVRVGL